MRFEACRSISVKCIWEIPARFFLESDEIYLDEKIGNLLKLYISILAE
jgi:hypothetical protein